MSINKIYHNFTSIVKNHVKYHFNVDPFLQKKYIIVHVFKFIIILSTLFLMSCSGVTFSNWHFPYTMDVEQGMYITKSQYKQLKLGLTKEKVAFILGSPLSQYLFDKNQWSYYYQKYANNKLNYAYTLTIIFNQNNEVIEINKTGDDLFAM